MRRSFAATTRRHRVRALRALRGARVFVRGLHSGTHPLVANIVPIRRCNLSCTYCNQFDNSSTPVPTSDMLARIDRLAALGAAVITFTGGEPLLHPDLPELVARVRQHGAMRTANTNGYLLTVDHIYEQFRRLNRGSLLRFAHYAVFQRNLVDGKPNEWHCPAGGRFLYICEDGLVHFCSQQRGQPGIPLDAYGEAELKHWSAVPKSCSAFCSIPCVHETALLDRFRREPQATLTTILDVRKQFDPSFTTPLSIRTLRAVFLDSPLKRPLAATTVRLFGLKPSPRESRPPASPISPRLN